MDWKSWLTTDIGDLIRGRKPITLDDLQRATEAARALSDWLREILPIGPEVIDHMSYSEAMRDFLEQRPRGPNIAKGAMLLQPHPQGNLLTQVFLDEKNDLACDPTGKPYGRRLVVRNLDQELDTTFGDKDLVVVE